MEGALDIESLRAALKTIAKRKLEDESVVVKACQDLQRVDWKTDPESCKALIAEGALMRLVRLLTKFKDKLHIVEAAISAIYTLGSRADPIAVVESDAAGRIISTLPTMQSKPHMVRRAVVFLGNLAVNEHIKQLVRMQGGITNILAALKEHRADPEVLDDCFYALANLCVGSPENVTALMEGGAVELIVNAMLDHAVDAKVCKTATVLMNNICSGNADAQLLTVEKMGGKAAGKVLRQHFHGALKEDPKFKLSLLQLMASLASHPTNVPELLKEELFGEIIKVMKNARKDLKVLLMGVHVFSNAAANANKMDLETLINRQALLGIMAAAKIAPETDLGFQRVILQGLSNLTRVSDRTISEKVCTDLSRLVVPHVVDSLTRFKDKEGLVRLCVRAITRMAVNEDLLDAMREENLHITLVKTAKENMGDDGDEDLLMQMLTCISRTARGGSAAKLTQSGIGEILARLLALSIDDEEVIETVFRIAINLATIKDDPGNGVDAVQICSELVRVLAKPICLACKALKKPYFVELFCAWVTNMTIRRPVLPLLIQHGILDQIFWLLKHKKLQLDHEVMQRLITVLNVMMTRDGYYYDRNWADTSQGSPKSRSVKGLLKDKGETLMNLIRGILKQHPTEMLLKEQCGIFKYKLEAEEADYEKSKKAEMEELQDAAARARRRQRDAMYHNRNKKNLAQRRDTWDVSEAEIKAMSKEELLQLKAKSEWQIPTLASHLMTKLKAGERFIKYSQAAPPRIRHVLVDQNLRLLQWRDPDSTEAATGGMALIGCKIVPGIPEEKSDGKAFKNKWTKWFKKDMSPDVNKCLSIVHTSKAGEKTRELNLMCQSQTQRDEWVDALEKLIVFQQKIQEMKTLTPTEEAQYLNGGVPIESDVPTSHSKRSATQKRKDKQARIKKLDKMNR